MFVPKRTNRWAKAMGTFTMNMKERQIRGEYMRQIKASVPHCVGVDMMSLDDLRDVAMSINICDINRLAYNMRRAA